MARSTGLAVAGALALMLAGPRAWACEGTCGYGGYGYAAYPSYPPAPTYYYGEPAAYLAPPVYSYSYVGPAYSYAPPAYATYYTSRINVFQGPRWNDNGAYYYSPSRYRGCPQVRRIRAYSTCGGPRGYAGVRPSMSGPIIPSARRW